MELLKFNDAPKGARRGKNPAGFIGAGIMVAVMGLSSTLAGTISINTGSAVEFGQGIVNTAACDSSLTVTPVSSFDANPSVDTFTVSSLAIANLGTNPNGGDGTGCSGIVLEIRAYSGSTLIPLMDTSTAKVLTLFVPSSGVTTASNYYAKTYNFSPLSSSETTLRPGIAVTGTPGTSSEAGLTVTLSNLKIAASITKITVESRAPRTGLTNLSREDSDSGTS